MYKPIDNKAVRNILIIKIAAIGDLLLITPAVRVIRKNFPNAKITLLVGKWSKPIIESNPYIDEFIEVDDRIFFRIMPISLVRLILKLRSYNFDTVFVWHRSLAFRLFSWLLGVQNRIGFSRNGRHSFLTHYVEENSNIHEIFEYQTTLQALGIKTEEVDMDLPINSEDAHFAFALLEKQALQKNQLIIAVAPGGGKNPKETVPLKHWPWKNYALLCDWLIEKKNATILFLGNKNDASLIDNISASLHNKNSINLCGKTNLKQLAAIIKQSNLFIGNDSAPLHIAAAVKTTAISFFGPTNPKELAPINYQHKYFFAAAPCSPCYKNGKYPDCKKKICMEAIQPEEVFQAAQNILSSI